MLPVNRWKLGFRASSSTTHIENQLVMWLTDKKEDFVGNFNN